MRGVDRKSFIRTGVDGSGGRLSLVIGSVSRVLVGLSDMVRSSISMSDGMGGSSGRLAFIVRGTSGGVRSRLTRVRKVSATVDRLSDASGRMSSGTSRTRSRTRGTVIGIDGNCSCLRRSRLLARCVGGSVGRATSVVRVLGGGTVSVDRIAGIVDSVSSRAGLLTLGTTVRTTQTNRRNHNFTMITSRIEDLTTGARSSADGVRGVVSSLRRLSGGTGSGVVLGIRSVRRSILLSAGIGLSFSRVSRSIRSVSSVGALMTATSRRRFCIARSVSGGAAEIFSLIGRGITMVGRARRTTGRLSLLTRVRSGRLSFFAVGK